MTRIDPQVMIPEEEIKKLMEFGSIGRRLAIRLIEIYGDWAPAYVIQERWVTNARRDDTRRRLKAFFFFQATTRQLYQAHFFSLDPKLLKKPPRKL